MSYRGAMTVTSHLRTVLASAEAHPPISMPRTSKCAVVGTPFARFGIRIVFGCRPPRTAPAYGQSFTVVELEGVSSSSAFALFLVRILCETRSRTKQFLLRQARPPLDVRCRHAPNRSASLNEPFEAKARII